MVSGGAIRHCHMLFHHTHILYSPADKLIVRPTGLAPSPGIWYVVRIHNSHAATPKNNVLHNDVILTSTIMADGQGAAQAGPAVDLRDTEAMRSTLFYMLIDWNGSDLKNVYEPISQQIAYLFVFLLAGLAWRKTKRWNRERQERPIPYRVVKPPSEVITERAQGEGKKKRI